MKILQKDLLCPANAKFCKLDAFIDANDDRYYLVVNTIVGEIKLNKSATSILPKPPSSALNIWREKLGEEYADFITEFSRTFGTRLHESLERVVRGDDYTGHIFETYIDGVTAIGNELFICVEETDNYLGVCGTLDFLYLDKAGKYVLVDIKNHGRYYSKAEQETKGLDLCQDIQSSKKTKWREQLAIYARGLLDTYDIEVDRAEVWCYNHGTGCVSKPVEMTSSQLVEKWEAIRTKYLQKSTQS